jgi:hypothetical protein
LRGQLIIPVSIPSSTIANTASTMIVIVRPMRVNYPAMRM